MSESLQLTIDQGLARLTLNRPASLNAFDADLAHAWRDATAEAVARDDVGAILIDGNGRAFCAGGDVVAMSASMSGGHEITALAHVINAVVGASSKIGSRYANIGLTPDLSVSAQLARAVGERRALQLLLQDRMLTAEEAVDWGLVAEAVSGADPEAEADAVRERAEQVARFWLAGASAAYGQAKRLVRSQPSRSFEQQLSAEADSIGAAFDTADAQARIAGFAAASRKR